MFDCSVVPAAAIFLLGSGHQPTVSKDRKILSAVGGVVRVKLPELHCVLLRRLRECTMSVLCIDDDRSTNSAGNMLSDIVLGLLQRAKTC